jgi:hypothetical protein
MGAISSVNLLKNGIGSNQAKALVLILKGHPTLRSLCGNKGDETELEMSGKMGGAGDVIMAAAEITGNGALSNANVMGNSIGKEMLSKLQDIMRSKPNLVSLCGIADDATEVDLSGLGMDGDDAVILASELPDKGAILSVNLLENGIGVEQAKALVIILKEHSTLKSLCGNNGDASELDMSGKMEGADDAILLAAEIVDNGALTSLNISNNCLTRGVHDGSDYYGDGHYATDTTGICSTEANLFLHNCYLLLQVLSPLPAPSRIWGRWPSSTSAAISSELSRRKIFSVSVSPGTSISLSKQRTRDAPASVITDYTIEYRQHRNIYSRDQRQ